MDDRMNRRLRPVPQNGSEEIVFFCPLFYPFLFPPCSPLTTLSLSLFFFERVRHKRTILHYRA